MAWSAGMKSNRTAAPVVCGNVILASTAARTGGLCMPCKGGYRENIENGKRYAQERKQYLASPQAAYVTGQELHVNGGMFMA